MAFSLRRVSRLASLRGARPCVPRRAYGPARQMDVSSPLAAAASAAAPCAAPKSGGGPPAPLGGGGEEDELAKAKGLQRFKVIMKRYGPVAVGTYGALYVGTLGALYTAISTDLIGSRDALSFLHDVGLDRWIDVSSINPKAGNFMLAWVLAKVTEPVRLGATIVIVPPLARVLRVRAANKAEAAEAGSVEGEKVEGEQGKATEDVPEPRR